MAVGGERRATVKENGSGDTSRRRPAVIVVVLVLVVAVICGGGLWWHNHAVREHDQALTSYRAAVRDYASQEGRYRSYLDSDEVKSASAIKEEEVSDAKTVLAMSRDVKTTKPASSRKTSVKTALTGDASTGELKKATENLASQISRMKAEVRTIKAKVLAVNNAVNAKAAQDAADAAAAQARAASAATGGSGYRASSGGGSGYRAPSGGGSGYRAPSGGGSGYRAPSGGGSGYRAPSGGGSAPAPSTGGGHPTWTGTTDGSNATGHWDGNHFIGEQEF